MAIFNAKDKQKSKPANASKAKPTAGGEDKSTTPTTATNRNLTTVLKKARSSEKAYYATTNNVYVFEVDQSATKHDIRDAVRANYSVTPRRINIVKQKSRRSVSAQRRQSVSLPGLKKAYVYLKSGDQIDLV